MGIITGILKVLLIIIIVTALIFSVYLLGKDIIHIKEVINETKRNNGTCDFDWKSMIITCQYKNNTCFINGTQEFNCQKNI